MKKDGFDFSFDENKCNECDGNCCIGESGYIWINMQEIEKFAKAFEISVDEFREKYLIKVGYKFSIKEVEYSSGKFACVFFDFQNKNCSVYDLRPTQCRTFPFWDYFKTNLQEVQKECIAIKV
ncbi:YkgJ family cysteine cluster protein [Arcobacter sp. FWKO B]|nr:YkgJ family cysteine cluster protein [Arcobacter sp. FWKO B]QOG13319.1 YkgJ family cysteine cluster protein [Arcobacter sp. FWKO B]